MKVDLVTTWKVRCGIATYSGNLARALADRKASVYVTRVSRFGEKDRQLMEQTADSVSPEADVIHVQHEYGIWQSLEEPFYRELKSHGKPIITTMHSVGKWDTDPIVAGFSDGVIVHNEFCARRFSSSGPCVIIPHGCIDPVEVPPPEECKKALAINPEYPIVGYCGFISEGKGMETLIAAMSEVKDACLLVAGGWFTAPEPPYIQRLKISSQEALGRRVHWLGYVEDEKLPLAYGAMDAFVYPSRQATESGALLMAMSHGRAIIASDLPPFREKFDATDPPPLTTFTDTKDLAMKIGLLLKDGGKREELQRGARAYAREHSWSQVSGLHLGYYDHILNKSKSSK